MSNNMKRREYRIFRDEENVLRRGKSDARPAQQRRGSASPFTWCLDSSLSFHLLLLLLLAFLSSDPSYSLSPLLPSPHQASLLERERASPGAIELAGGLHPPRLGCREIPPPARPPAGPSNGKSRLLRSSLISHRWSIDRSIPRARSSHRRSLGGSGIAAAYGVRDGVVW